MTERNLEETEFFNSIEKMISADSVQKYGKKVSIYHMHLNIYILTIGILTIGLLIIGI